MERMERVENSLEHNKIKLNVLFSPESEVSRVEQTLKKYEWYRAKNYPLTFPPNIGTNSADIESAVEEDFDASVYEQKAKEICELWEKLSKEFFEKARSFNLLTQAEYELYLTRYGVGGSYVLPNRIIINFSYQNYEKIENVMMVVFHEIIHLAIEKWIKENGIDHWTKERLVDLIYNSIFDKKAYLQTDPKNSEKVEQIFNSYFPDIKRVIVELSTKEQ